jgi:subtilisin family serine protease
MKKLVLRASFFLLALGVFAGLNAQQVDKSILNWYNGATPGMATEKAYRLVSKRTPEDVVVAIIDSGVDIEHEDLKGQIWVNTKEIPGNGIDDDKNGYIDDIHGWNFLGNAKGENANDENLEFVRIYKMGKSKFEGKADSEIASSDKEAFKLWKECADKLKKERAEAEQMLATYTMLKEQVLPKLPILVQQAMGKESYTLTDLKKWKPKTQEHMQIRELAIQVESGDLSEAEIEEGLKHFRDQLAYNLNPDFDGRKIVGDDPFDFSQRNYGNNDVKGPDALHGTHVAGIVGSLRGNGLGGDGVAAPVKLMSLRAVPNGDEYDKDVAFAIRYAVDNGASVINMSFGKAYSTHPKEVYDAMKYAEQKGVLLVHAAGNDAANIDVTPNFPAVKFSFQQEDFKNLLTIGASTRFAKGNLAASFSNYGANSVDVFAPGFEIYNTIPENKYRKLQGTSMAAPAVSGTAAFLKAYFPELSMIEIKDILLKTATPYGKTLQTLPGSDQKVAFSTLSRTGGVVNLEAAVKMAMKMTAQK